MRRALPTTLVLLVLLAFPIGAGSLYSDFYLSLAIRVFAFVILLLGFDLLAGYGGLISFGHAMFFGTGAYAAALTLKHLTTSVWAALAVAVVVSAGLALVVGFLSIRAREIYFVFLTFAFAQFAYHAVNSWEWAGAANGLPGIPPPSLWIAGRLPVDLDRRAVFYYFALAVAAAAFLVARRIAASAFGRVLVGIRENEERARFLGYDVTRCLRRAFLISGVFAGLGGAVLACFQSFVAPTLYHWSVSGEVLLMALLGGMGTLVGPMAGAAFVIVLGDFLSSWLAERWLLVMGLIYASCVLFSPTGFAGIARRLGALRGSAETQRAP
ncbi:MAG: branched-chain amino acid ABC transporter permease [Candidatus Rokubacteria bacterium]|nr:branched-chain amino acid ABC transporter permease [Candidatus Rokubacteria bacterium]MBI3106720.1 branched-chain amino acid ABC transporter permease [Candidatus Rokubacteria bacterium]